MTRHNISLAAALVTATTLVGCVGSQEQAYDEDVAPSLEVTSPQRGTMSSGANVTVTGTASDAGSGIASVEVNGTKATVAADGSFTVNITVGEGVQVIRTIAKDKAGNEIKDVRAVMAGTLAPVEQKVSNAVVARIGSSAMSSMSTLLSSQATAMDFTAMAKAVNPIAEDGGCLGYKANLLSINKSDVAISMTPNTGALGATVDITNLDVAIKVNFKVACVGGSSTLHIRATKAHLAGNLALAATNGQLTSNMDNVEVTFENFNVEASGVPGAVVDLFQSKVNNAAIKAVKDAVNNAVPDLIESQLASLAGESVNVDLIGKQLSLALAPDTITLDPAGLLVTLSGNVNVEGSNGAEYVSNPMPVSGAMGASSQDAAIGLADDFANQLFAGVWASGLLKSSMTLPPEVPLEIFFGSEAKKISYDVMLPPTLSSDGNGQITLTVGDALITVATEGDQEIAKFATSISIPVEISFDATGKAFFSVGVPVTDAQIISQDATKLPRALTELTIKAVGEAGASQIGALAGQALSSVPVPFRDNLEQVQVSTAGGYVMLGAKIKP